MTSNSVVQGEGVGPRCETAAVAAQTSSRSGRPPQNILTASRPFGVAQAAFHIPSLDGIRAVAFALVFIAHASLSFEAFGAFGVSVFFFLSGFLITTLLRRENDRHGTISLRKFYFRRALRIGPPFYLTVIFILMLVEVGITDGRIEAGPIVAATAYGANYWEIFKGFHIRGFSPFWSLAVEEHFYLLYPLLFLFMNRAGMSYKKQALLLGGICGAVLTWRLALVLGMNEINEFRIMYGTDTRIDTILFGCILALAANPVMDHEAKPSFGLSFLGLSVVLFTAIYRGPLFRLTGRYTLQGIAFMPLFTFAIAKSGSYFRWLNWGWVRFIGTLSYTLYLIHLTLLKTAQAHFRPRAVSALIAIVASVLYAYSMYRVVEAPAAQLRNLRLS
jgi:peptidoglycan/LPS O-acetylase OafA/YrhL